MTDLGSATKSDCEFVVVQPDEDELNQMNQTMPLDNGRSQSTVG